MNYQHFIYLVKRDLATQEIIESFLKEHGLENMTKEELTEHLKQAVKTSGTKIHTPTKKEN